MQSWEGARPESKRQNDHVRSLPETVEPKTSPLCVPALLSRLGSTSGLQDQFVWSRHEERDERIIAQCT